MELDYYGVECFSFLEWSLRISVALKEVAADL